MIKSAFLHLFSPVHPGLLFNGCNRDDFRWKIPPPEILLCHPDNPFIIITVVRSLKCKNILLSIAVFLSINVAIVASFIAWVRQGSFPYVPFLSGPAMFDTIQRRIIRNGKRSHQTPLLANMLSIPRIRWSSLLPQTAGNIVATNLFYSPLQNQQEVRNQFYNSPKFSFSLKIFFTDDLLVTYSFSSNWLSVSNISAPWPGGNLWLHINPLQAEVQPVTKGIVMDFTKENQVGWRVSFKSSL